MEQETFDITPTWSALLIGMLDVYRTAPAEQRKIILRECQRMAQAADQWNDYSRLLPIGTKVMCNGAEDEIVRHVHPTDTENYKKGYRYELKENGTQSQGSIGYVKI